MSSIVWLASYPKSGNTWIRAFLQNYLRTGPGPADINAFDERFADESKPYWYEPYVEGPLEELSLSEVCALRPRVHRDIAASRQGTVIVKTHGFMGAYEDHPLHDMAVTAGAIYVIRHPLDVALSVADHFGLSLDEAIAFMNDPLTGTPTDEANVASVLTSWSNHVESWTITPGPHVHVVRYEDLLDKPARAFGEILKFLKIAGDKARVKQAIAHSAFGALRRQEAASGFVERSPNATRFFRVGKKNQWPEWLNAAQVDTLVSAHRRQMRRFRYTAPGV